MRRTFLTLAAVIAAVSSSRAANVVPQTTIQQTYSAFTPTGFTTIIAGPTSSNVAMGSTGLPNQAFVAYVQNIGTVPVNLQIGTDATVTASTTSGFYLPPGGCASLNAISGSTPGAYVAAITAGGTAQVNIVTGYGNPGAACPSGSSGGTISDPNTAPIGTFGTPFAVGATVAPGRELYANCTVAGSLTMMGAGGGTITYPVIVGGNRISYAITSITASTATCTTYQNNK